MEKAVFDFYNRKQAFDVYHRTILQRNEQYSQISDWFTVSTREIGGGGRARPAGLSSLIKQNVYVYVCGGRKKRRRCGGKDLDV